MKYIQLRCPILVIKDKGWARHLRGAEREIFLIISARAKRVSCRSGDDSLDFRIVVHIFHASIEGTRLTYARA